MFVYFLSEGKIEILKESENKSYGTLETGDYFGHMSLMLNEVSTVSLKTLTYCDLFVLNKEAFENLKSRYPEFLHLLKEVSVEKSLRASEWLMEGIMI
jgi:CRP-like cAMP-binding protein